VIRYDPSDLRDQLISVGVARPGEIVGCTPAEIEEVARDQGTDLPAAYRAFLALMGRKAGALFVGSDVFYPEVLQLRQAAEGLLEVGGARVGLPPTAVVFLMHQGHTFMYIDAGEGQDPPVRKYQEGWEAPVRHADHFTSYLASAIEGQARLRRAGPTPRQD
jgi:hypothetical protein